MNLSMHIMCVRAIKANDLALLTLIRMFLSSSSEFINNKVSS